MTSVCAAVIWYDEHPEDLREMALSLRGFCTSLVAVDGAFENFPDAKPCSPPEQAAALLDGCAEAGLEALVFQSGVVGRWRGHEGEEVPKRNAAFHLCAAFCPEWVVVIDADMRLTQSDGALELMNWTDAPVAVTSVDGSPHRHMFRWDPTLRYFRTHYIAVNSRATLACPTARTPLTEPLPPLVNALDMTRVLFFSHQEKRQEGRRASADAYYRSRDGRGVESLSPIET